MSKLKKIRLKIALKSMQVWNIAKLTRKSIRNLGAATWKNLSPSVTLVLNVNDVSKIPLDDLRLYVPCDFKETKF